MGIRYKGRTHDAIQATSGDMSDVHNKLMFSFKNETESRRATRVRQILGGVLPISCYREVLKTLGVPSLISSDQF